MLSNAEMLADQAAVFSDFPTETITIGATSYNCLVLDHRDDSEWTDGGKLASIQAMVAIERSAIDGAIPSTGDTCTFREETLRIGAVDSDDKAASVTLALTYPTT